MRIYTVIDGSSWCWATTAREVAARLPQHEFFFTSSPTPAEAQEYDLIWNRGYPYLFRNAAKAGVPMVWTFSTGGARAEIQIDRCRPFFGHGATIVCQNEQTRRLLLEIGERHVVVIPNGVNVDRFCPADGFPPECVVGMAANVNGERWVNKGADAVVEACRKGNIPLVMATKPAPGRESRVPEFDRGRVSHEEMPEFLRGLSVFAQPSSAEGCSNSIMEAMACGLPCIICRESGYHGEVCRDGRDDPEGEVLFVEHGNADEILGAINGLIRFRLHAKRIGNNARILALRHGWKAVARIYDDVFLSTAGRSNLFHLVTVAGKSYGDCLRRFLPTWVKNSGAETITVFSDAKIDGLPPEVEIRTDMEIGTTWIDGCMAKAEALVRLARERTPGERCVFLDADCAVLRDLRPFAVGREDLALTRLAVDPAAYPRCAGTCSSGALAFTINDRTKSFLNLWAEVQGAYARNGHGVKSGKVAADQYALTDLARGRACGVTIRAMDEHVWNNAPDLFDEAWLEDIAKHRAAVLHFKGGRWRDEKLVRRAIEAANPTHLDRPTQGQKG